MDKQEWEGLLVSISAYKDCMKFRRDRGEEFCWNCCITGSGVVEIPDDVCDLTNEEREKKIDDALDRIYKAYINDEIRLSGETANE